MRASQSSSCRGGFGPSRPRLEVAGETLGRLLLLATVSLAACTDSGSPTGTGDATEPVPTSVLISSLAVELMWLGQTHQLTATVRDQSGLAMPNVSVTWASADPGVASVSSGGVVTAAANGNTMVTATASGLSATVPVSVQQIPASVSVSPATILLNGVGDTVRITAVVSDQGGSEIAEAAVSWSSTDEAVATVSEEGLVTAAAPGQIEVVAEVAGAGAPVSDQASVTVQEALLIVTTELPSGVEAVAYGQTLEAAGGNGAYSWDVAEGALPAGIGLDGSTGLISGTPTSIGRSSFTVRVTSGTYATSRELTLDVYGPLRITTSSMPDGQKDQAYSASVAQSGGNGPFVWTVSQGALPAGLTLNAVTGAITGIPTVAGDGVFTVRVTSDDGQIASRSLTLSIKEMPPAPSRLRWPVPGSYGADWVINNYVDLDSGPGIRDYRGGSKSYNGHNGVDIDVPNFRWMDNGFRVIAARGGRVTGVIEDQPDRNTSCTGTWNVVVIVHADGSSAWYGHLKRNSAAVSVGQQVSAGATLGVIGSSGCSTQPHLHFELRDAANRVIDPFKEGMWEAPPSYSPPLAFMDGALRNGAFTHIDQLKDPSPNVASITVGSTLGVGLSMAGGGPGDEITVRIVGGSGALLYDFRKVFDNAYRHTYWHWYAVVTADPGAWKVQIYTNGTLRKTYKITVS
jgi:murein DD-endopeptidase MepM/ murein hydrolase activator NlpD